MTQALKSVNRVLPYGRNFFITRATGAPSSGPWQTFKSVYTEILDKEKATDLLLFLTPFNELTSTHKRIHLTQNHSLYFFCSRLRVQQ